jgi:hypothetical protein
MPMTDRSKMAMDGCIKNTTSSFSKVKPLREGPIVKGGVNLTTRITTRPPPPAPMRPAGKTTASSSKGK